MMVINIALHSLNLPIAHISVWLLYLIWISFNLSALRIEINEGEDIYAWPQALDSTTASTFLSHIICLYELLSKQIDEAILLCVLSMNTCSLNAAPV